ASTIYGFLFVAGQLISSMSLMIILLIMMGTSEPLASILKKRHLHDLGKLLLAFLMLWAYFGFSQLLIIWSGNQPEEISFFYSRLYGSWGVVAIIVLVCHFFIPFFILLGQDIKKNTRWMPILAIWLIVMRFVDLLWLTRPDLHNGSQFSPLDIILP